VVAAWHFEWLYGLQSTWGFSLENAGGMNNTPFSERPWVRLSDFSAHEPFSRQHSKTNEFFFSEHEWAPET
jgi:hypothetical protein